MTDVFDFDFIYSTTVDLHAQCVSIYRICFGWYHII